MSCDNNKTDLESRASEPKSVSGDQGNWTNHGLKDQIELDRYLKSRDAAKSKKSILNGIYGARYIPPSANGN